MSFKNAGRVAFGVPVSLFTARFSRLPADGVCCFTEGRALTGSPGGRAAGVESSWQAAQPRLCFNERVRVGVHRLPRDRFPGGRQRSGVREKSCPIKVHSCDLGDQPLILTDYSRLWLKAAI